MASILDADGKWCGIVTLHVKDSSRGARSSKPMEFVRISDGDILSACLDDPFFPEARFVKQYRGPTWYHYTNVLATRTIPADEGTAKERIGIGRITQDAWAAVNKVSEDVRLY